MNRILLKHSYPLPKHTVGLLRSFAEEKASFMGVGGGTNKLLLKSQISIIASRSLVRRYLCISCFGILVFVFGSVWEVEWVVGRDKCQSVGLRKQSLLLPRQLPPLTLRATDRPTGPATQPLHRPSMSSRAGGGGKWFHIPAFGALGTQMVVGCWLVGWETELGWSKEPITRSSNLVWSLH